MNNLYETSRKLIKSVNTDFIRYKFHDIKWENKMLGLVGPRGVGKTTLFLQYIKLNLNTNDTLYVSADNIYFANHTLIELADYFNKQGGKHLFIDEIHKYANWSQELKQLYDSFPDLQIFFTGSSVLDIYKGMADLSRRAPIYKMQGLSFREFLGMFHKIELPSYTLDEILNNEIEIPNVSHPLPLFNEYLRHGYYPFGKDIDFDIELEQIITQTMEIDIPQYANLNVSTGRKLKKLLSVIAESVPFKPVMTKLADIIEVSRNTITDYLSYIEKAGMIIQLRDETGGIRSLGKIEKIYLDNPNIANVLARNKVNIGNMRETFFCNQMRVNHDVISSSTSDFQIDDKIFEVGGKNKSKKQIQDLCNAYVVKDDIEYGHGNIIPLWYFGLNY